MSETVCLPEVVIGSLSPSRASDFKTCPLLYRFRTIDRIPEAPSPGAVRGTVVHAVLERLFDLPAGERSLDAAQALVEPAWAELRAETPGLAALFETDPDGADEQAWLDSARGLVESYFAIEDPSRLEPAGREELVEAVVDGLRLRGYVDRLDVSPAGDVRIVDYKTGTIPREAFEAKALFQMKFYALVLWRTRGVVPRQLKLIYLSDPDTLTYTPDAEELARFERTLKAIWVAIARATEKGDFRANPGRLCAWCDHQVRCPSFGGTPPPFPTDALTRIDRDRRESPKPAVEPEL
jgi:putative RecB family exonuclease